MIFYFTIFSLKQGVIFRFKWKNEFLWVTFLSCQPGCLSCCVCPWFKGTRLTRQSQRMTNARTNTLCCLKTTWRYSTYESNGTHQNTGFANQWPWNRTRRRCYGCVGGLLVESWELGRIGALLWYGYILASLRPSKNTCYSWELRSFLKRTIIRCICHSTVGFPMLTLLRPIPIIILKWLRLTFTEPWIGLLVVGLC